MFFKKKPQSQSKSKSEGRAQYRKRNSKTSSLEAVLKAPKWKPLTVELMDLSVRGAGIRVPFAQDRNLNVNDVVEITIGSMMRDEVVTAARVANITRDGESHIRYGLEFLNINGLFSQLDNFYARHFNRRRHVRVLPSLDRKVQAKLRFAGEEITGNVFDVSESGLGIVLSKDNAARVADIQQFEICVKLPGMNGEMVGPAKVQHRSAMQSQTLLGLQFDVEDGGGFARYTGELRTFIAARSAEMSMWEKSWG